MATNTKDEMTEIPITDWPNLRDLFKDNLPQHWLAYSTVENRIQLKKKFPSRDFQMFALNNDWSDGTFLLVDGVHRNLYTLQENSSRLNRLLSLHDWNSGPRIHPYMSQHKLAVDNTFQKLGYEVEYNDPVTLWWLPKEKGLEIKLEIPDDVYISSLKLEHSILINSVWPNSFPGSVRYIENLIVTNQSRGVFAKETNELRAWVLRLNNGVLTALQTHDSHFRKGYGSLVLQAMAKAEAEEGRDTAGGVNENNIPSTKMFEKLGFQNIGIVYFCRNLPKD